MKNKLSEMFDGKYFIKGSQDYYYTSSRGSIRVSDYKGGGGIEFDYRMMSEFDDLIMSLMKDDGHWREITKDEFMSALQNQLKRIDEYIPIQTEAGI